MPPELPTIVVVEDDPHDLEMTLEALEECLVANEIVTLRDGAAALDYFRARGEFTGRPPARFGVILLDLKLPKVDGLEVLQAIKADERLRTIPVVVLTSSREEKDLVRSYQLGVNSFVVKPVRFEEFMAAIRQLGVYWAIVNEPPPDLRRPASDG
jgi:CheY-like chemotaxis protein